MTEPTAPATYSRLREQVQAVLAEGKVQTRQATECERVDAYWHVGDAIHVHILAREGRAGYGQRIVANLSQDLNLGESLLHEIVRFRRFFPILYARRELAWGHYRTMLRLPSNEHRRFYERMADRHHWSTRELESQIKTDLYRQTRDRPDALPEGDDPFDGRPLRPRRGRLYTYCIKKLPGTEGRIDDLRIDLGFDVLWNIDLIGLTEPRHNMIVTSTKRAGSGFTGQYHFETLTAQRRALFTYITKVTDVIDGDTLRGIADLGFGGSSSQKLRLKGIDAPELARRAGHRAKQFVLDRMTAVDFIVVTTSKHPGKFGRYITDIFYLIGESDPEIVLRKGVYLNQELLQERLATRYP